MAFTLMMSLLLLRFHMLPCEVIDSQKITFNSLDDNDSSRPFTVTTNRIKDDVNAILEDPISSINIDYLNNAVILQFRRSIPFEQNEVEAKRRSAVDKNFMRFGRNDRSLMRFGKRQPESVVDQRSTINNDNRELRSQRGGSDSDNSRSSRADNFMRFGRLDKGFMRFGRSGELQQQQEQPNRNLMRFGRSNSMMRFGRADGRIRFGKRDGSLMRFGRSEKEINRSERGDSFMRFGRNPNNQFSSDNLDFLDQLNNDQLLSKKINNNMEKRDRSLMRFGRNEQNFMRSGKLDQNFMRFGKRNNEGTEEILEQITPNDLETIYRLNMESPDYITERTSTSLNESSESGSQYPLVH